MKKRKPKKPRRVVLGVGWAWQVAPDTVLLMGKDGQSRRLPRAVVVEEKLIRLVAEVL